MSSSLLPPSWISSAFFWGKGEAYLELGHAGEEVCALADELLHLGGEHHIGEVQPAVLVVVVEVIIFVGVSRADLGTVYWRYDPFIMTVSNPNII